MTPTAPAALPFDFAAYDSDLETLDQAKDGWARTDIATRIEILKAIKRALMKGARDWVDLSSAAKGLPKGAAVTGEEWMSGPYVVMSACNALIKTLSGMQGKTFLGPLGTRVLASGQTAVRVVPNSMMDRVLMSGITADVWMQHGVNAQNLPDHAASAYDQPAGQRSGRLALVLGAGNINSIAPMDCFQKLFLENQVVMLKMNPVNDYLTPVLGAVLAPLIARDALRIVTGDGAVGSYLVRHPLVSQLHITGSGSTHDAIVWGPGAAGIANKKAGTPLNRRPITSELGAVCPTIVVPGPWSRADIRFQAENIASQKLHNSGFNCIACQVLILPADWPKADALMGALKAIIARVQRPAYYPGAQDRLKAFVAKGRTVARIDRGPDTPAFPVVEIGIGAARAQDHIEVFAPALATHRIKAPDAESYLRAAISYANQALYGTLGANIVIHPATIRAIGAARFEAMIGDLHYGTIAINCWTGVAFSLAQCPWGAFPGHTLSDVQSGIGTVHNSFMLEQVERCVITAPWRPFPRGLLSGSLSLMPRPPWFITHRKQHKVARLLTEIQYKPRLGKLGAVLWAALTG